MVWGWSSAVSCLEWTGSGAWFVEGSAAGNGRVVTTWVTSLEKNFSSR